MAYEFRYVAAMSDGTMGETNRKAQKSPYRDIWGADFDVECMGCFRKVNWHIAYPVANMQWLCDRCHR